MPKTTAEHRAQTKWEAKVYDKICLRVPKGKRDEIAKNADAAGQSLNAYILTAIDAYQNTDR